MIGVVRGRTLCAGVLFHISLSLGVCELLGTRGRRKIRRRGVHRSRRGGDRCRRSILPREQSSQAPAPLHRHGSITSIGGRGGISRLPVHRPDFVQRSIINASRKLGGIQFRLVYLYYLQELVSQIRLRSRTRVMGMAGRSISSQGARLHHNSESEPKECRISG